MLRWLMVALAIAAGTLPGAARAEDAVVPRLALTRAEWRCLQSRLDRYLRDAVDPVLASVLGCGQPAPAGAALAVRLDPVIAPRVDAAGDADAARKVFFLTRAQLTCLKTVIGSLIDGDDGDALIPYDLSGCPAAAAR